MDVTFSFMTAPGVYTASLPDYLSKRTVGCVIRVHGFGRSVVLSDTYPDGRGVDRPVATYTLVSRLTDRVGRSVDLLTSTLEPSRWGMVWTLTDGYVSTWGDPLVEDQDAVRNLVGGLAVSEDGLGGAILDLGTAAMPGDIRRADQRDDVTFYAEASPSLLDTLKLSFAGALASDRTIRQADHVSVSAASPLGVEVGTGVEPSDASQATAIVNEVARSVARLR
jgi:hypothetical protein